MAEQPSYLIQFPNEEYRDDVKVASAKRGMTMKEFILTTLSEAINETKLEEHSKRRRW